MIISTMMVITKVKRVFMEQGSSANIIFQYAFDKVELKNSDLQSYVLQKGAYQLLRRKGPLRRVRHPLSDLENPTSNLDG